MNKKEKEEENNTMAPYTFKKQLKPRGNLTLKDGGILIGLHDGHFALSLGKALPYVFSKDL